MYEYRKTIDPLRNKDDFEEMANQILEREMSGYRFIKGELVAITNKDEIESIDQAVTTTVQLGLEGASEHLTTALQLLGKKPDPDYRNSIKESISAVEATVKKISGEHGGWA